MSSTDDAPKAEAASAAGPAGVVLLNTRFPRPPGDIGNPASFTRPVLYRRVEAARVAAVVRDEGVTAELAEAILAAAQALVDEGATTITTSCGYLGELQARLTAALPVPVIASALALLPEVQQRHGPGARIGVLTFDARRLKPLHFGGLWSDDLTIEGLEQGRELHAVIREDRPTLDLAAAERDVAEASRRLSVRAGRLDAVILECTNLGPYREAVRRETGAAVYGLVTALNGKP